jgi:hypothetical protein
VGRGSPLSHSGVRAGCWPESPFSRAAFYSYPTGPTVRIGRSPLRVPVARRRSGYLPCPDQTGCRRPRRIALGCSRPTSRPARGDGIARRWNTPWSPPTAGRPARLKKTASVIRHPEMPAMGAGADFDGGSWADYELPSSLPHRLYSPISWLHARNGHVQLRCR